MEGFKIMAIDYLKVCSVNIKIQLKSTKRERDRERERERESTHGTFLTIQVTTPPTESPITRTSPMAAIIFSAYSGSGHLTMLLSVSH